MESTPALGWGLFLDPSLSRVKEASFLPSFLSRFLSWPLGGIALENKSVMPVSDILICRFVRIAVWQAESNGGVGTGGEAICLLSDTACSIVVLVVLNIAIQRALWA